MKSKTLLKLLSLVEKKQIISGVCKVGSWKVKIGLKKHSNF
jgi:hypothetical protein